MSEKGRNANSALSCNLNYMVETYGPKLRIPVGTKAIAQWFEEQYGEVSERTVRLILHGTGSPNPHPKTLQALTKCFRPAVPAIQDSWWTLSDHSEFLRLARPSGSKDSVQLVVPNYHRAILGLEHRWCGTYIAYRYSFEARTDGLVAREVIHIWLDNSVMRFRMSYWAEATTHPGQKARFFEGTVLPVGLSVFLVGLSSDGEHDRGRSLFFHDDRSPGEMRDCKFGLLTSTRLHGDYGPCVACIFLVRVDWVPSDLDTFMQDATCIYDTDQMLHEDFGSNHDIWLKGFLDNRPRGTPKEPEYAEVDGHPKYRDPVLRLDRIRFIERMPEVLAEVMRDDKIQSPFKAGWPGRFAPAPLVPVPAQEPLSVPIGSAVRSALPPSARRPDGEPA